MRLLPLTLAALLALASGALAADPVVLFDQGHGQKFVIEKKGDLHLSGLADAFRRAGFEVRATDAPLTPEALAGVKAVVSSGAFKDFTLEEVKALLDYVKEGGRLAVMLHIPTPYVEVLIPFGIVTSMGVIHEDAALADSDSINFKATNLGTQPVFAGLKAVAFHGTWALRNINEQAIPLVRTSAKSWMDINGNNVWDSGKEEMGPYAVAMLSTTDKGECFAFADDAVFQDRFLEGDNLKLADQLARWFGR